MSTWTPRPRAQTSASGESGAPTVSSAAPRRAASAASASGPGARPDWDTAMTRSSGPIQPGQRGLAARRHRDRRPGLGEHVEDVAHDGRAAERGDEHRPGAVTAGDPVDPGLAGGDDRPAHLGAGGGERAQRPAAVERLERLHASRGTPRRGAARSCAAGQAGQTGLRRLVDEQHRDAVVDAVDAARTRRRCRPARGRSHPSRRAARTGSSGSAGSRAARAPSVDISCSSRSASHEAQDIVAHRGHRVRIGCLDVEPEQGFGVGRPQVEPPHRVALRLPRGSAVSPSSSSTSTSLSARPRADRVGAARPGPSTVELISPDAAYAA